MKEQLTRESREKTRRKCDSARWSAGILIFFACILFSSAHAASGNKPNILFILADDLGWSDVGCNGSSFFETPNVDRLAREGVRFTQGYAPAPICSASRAAFLTGRSPARLQFEFVTKPKGAEPARNRALIPPPYPINLPLSEITTAEALQPAGYVTGFIGKWHLNDHHKRYLGYSPTHGPQKQGFNTVAEDRGSHPYGYKDRTFGEFDKGEFPPDQVTANAIQFLRKHREQPFLLHVSHYYVHDPVHTRCRWLHEKYETKAKRLGSKHAAAYGAMVETLDHYVGQLLEALDELGLRENTLVVFTSDNGGHPNYTSNAPLRGSKWNLYEGGVRVPWIIRWPGVTPTNAVCNEPIIGMDLFPTFCEVAGADLPTNREPDGQSLLALLKAPRETSTPPRTFTWHFPYYHPEKNYDTARQEIGVGDFAISQTRPQSTIRQGNWKLIHFFDTETSELYNLESDPGEQHDLSGRKPETTAKLLKELRYQLTTMDARLPEKNDAAP